MSKPLVNDIVKKFNLTIDTEDYIPVKDMVQFFEWAYNEGKKDQCNCRNSRNPTKMELATT